MSKTDDKVVDLCGGSSPPKKTEELKQQPSKKSKTTIYQLEQDFKQAKSDIESKYKSKMDQEIYDLTMKHNSAVQEIREREVREKAGTLEAETVCGTCGKSISDEELEENEEKYFICENCTYHCIEHKGDTTECNVCGCHYCDACLDSIDKCGGCMRADKLTCCGLEKMPCGEYECTESNCNYFHEKHCHCEREDQYRY